MTARQGNPPGSPWRSTSRKQRGARTGRKGHEVQLTPERWAKLRRIGAALGGGVPEALEALIDAWAEPSP